MALLKEWEATAYVCSNHFFPGDILKINNAFHLKKNALPLQYENENTSLIANDNSSNFSIDIDAASANTLAILTHETIQATSFDVQEEVVTDCCCKNPIKIPVKTFKTNKTVSITDHNYCKNLSKNPVKTFKINKTQSKIALLQRAIRTLRNRMNIKEKMVKRKYGRYDNLLQLSKFIQEFVEILLKHINQKSTPRQYSPELREFALTLHYYSPAAYNYVRSIFNDCLPCDVTIRNWYRSVDGEPGFTNDSLIALQNLQLGTPYPIVGCLMVDGIHLRKHLQNNGNSTFGNVDYGGVIPNDKRTMANESLTFMFVGMNIPIKIPMGYFLISGISASQLDTLIEICIQLIRDTKVITGTLAFDGLKSNFASIKNLGCDWRDIENIKSTLDIDGSSENVYAWPDMSHMIKLFRNTFHDLGGFKNKFGQQIEWKYIVRLHDLQNNLGVHFGNKLRRLHVNYKNQIMKVYLATQLISNSVADAIQICDKSFLLPDFEGCSVADKVFRHSLQQSGGKNLDVEHTIER